MFLDEFMAPADSSSSLIPAPSDTGPLSPPSLEPISMQEVSSMPAREDTYYPSMLSSPTFLPVAPVPGPRSPASVQALVLNTPEGSDYSPALPGVFGGVGVTKSLPMLAALAVALYFAFGE